MTKQERLATMRALQDILQARRSATFGSGMGNMGGVPPQIPVDPRLNKPQPPGTSGKQAVHDPDNILSQRQSTPVQLPDGQQPAQNDSEGENADSSDSQDMPDGSPSNQQPGGDNDHDSNSDGREEGDGHSEGGGAAGNDASSATAKGSGSDEGASSDEQSEQSAKKAKQDDDEFAVYKSPDYKKGWNSIIAKYDRDDVTEQELQDLISQIESGILQI